MLKISFSSFTESFSPGYFYFSIKFLFKLLTHDYPEQKHEVFQSHDPIKLGDRSQVADSKVY